MPDSWLDLGLWKIFPMDIIIELKEKANFMLKVYYWDVCPHCHAAMDFLKSRRIKFEALDIEKQPKNIVDKVIEVNGGDDWVVPTLEYKGKWRPGQIFDAKKLESDLRDWGLRK